MTSAHTDSDLVRLRQFLKTLEAEAKIAVGGIDPNTREIEILKREIAYLERVQQERNSASPRHDRRPDLVASQMIAWRTLAETHSLRITVPIMTSKMSETWVQ